MCGRFTLRTKLNLVFSQRRRDGGGTGLPAAVQQRADARRARHPAPARSGNAQVGPDSELGQRCPKAQAGKLYANLRGACEYLAKLQARMELEEFRRMIGYI